MTTPYDNLTDEELLRIAFFDTNPLVRALMERLEIRLRDIADFSGEVPPIDEDTLDLPLN